MQDLQQMMVDMRAAAITDARESELVDEQAREEWSYAAGLAIWVFGLPLMRAEQFRRLLSALDGPVETMPYAPPNQMGHMRFIPTADSDLPFTPNVDTLYSGSLLELADGPIIFRAPAMPDRYWSLQVADAFFSNQPYLGTRATGTDAGVWMFVAPDWSGEVPDGVTLYRSASNTAVFALRVRIEGESDTEAVVKAQHGFRVTSLDSYLADDERPAPAAEPPVMPSDTHDLAYFTTLCRLLEFNPPYARDGAIVALMGLLGLAPGTEIDPDHIDPAVRRGLVRAADEGPRIIGWKVKYRGHKSASMWNVDLTGGCFGTDYLARAEGSIQGLFVHDPEECTYFHTYHDGNGDPLDGGRSYTISFGPDQIPPTLPFGFWSITGYNTSYTLIDNEAGRYSVQSSDPALVRRPDGGLTVHVGPATPSDGAVANWVGTERGEPFRLNFRVYLPRARLLDPVHVEEYLPPTEPVGDSSAAAG